MRPTLPLAKNAAKAVEATARYEGRQLSKTMDGVLSRFRGSILDAMARRMPEEDRVFLAERWGFSSPSTSNRQSGSVEPSTSEVVEPKTSAPVSATRSSISAEEQALMNARAAGAAARKALESGATLRYSKADATMSGHDRQDKSKGESAKSSDGPQASLSSARDESTEAARAAARTEQEKVLHPILGELIADLKYKRVYRTSIASLVKAPVWEKQRILRPERAMAIAEAKLKKEFNGIPGVITLFERETARSSTADPGTSDAGSTQGNTPKSGSSIEDEGPSRLGIVDGQHRVGGLMLMAERGGWDSTERNILVDVFRTSNDKDIADLFTEINRAEPVLLVDMPGDGATEMVKEILNECTERMQEAYPEMFKASLRCRPPHVNIDNLRDESTALFSAETGTALKRAVAKLSDRAVFEIRVHECIYQSGLMARHGVKSADELYVWLTRVNAALERRGDEGWAELSKGYKGMSQEVFNKALNKARKHRFFLGMDRSWLHVV